MILVAPIDTASPVAAESAAERDAEVSLIFRRHHDFVWRSLRRLGVDGSVVDDAVQDVFFVVHRRLPEFEGRASMRTWLFRIAMRVAMSHRRKTRRRDAVEPLPVLPDPAAGPDDEVARRQALALLDALLERLDERLRTVFVLSELHGLSGPEIAETLELKLNTVYSRLRLARAAVEKGLARHRARGESIVS